jgi:hypothetical protein
MDSEGDNSSVGRIGVAAGKIWQALRDNGSVTLSALPTKVGEPRDLVMQAVGWLAREDKLIIAESGRTKTISLRNE